MNLRKEIRNALLIGAAIFLVMGVIKYIMGYPMYKGSELLVQFLYNQMYSLVLYLSNAYFFTYLIRRNQGLLFTTKHVATGIIGAVVISLVAIFFLRALIIVGIQGASSLDFLDNESPQYYFVTFLISMVVTVIFYIFYYYRHAQERKVKEQKIIARTASAQFDALKNQLDPHFLFNSLNVLTSLIEENPEAATKFTTALSKVYRYVLEQKNKELVTLEEELDFAKLYMSLIEMRFEESIVFVIPEHLSNPEAKVVPLSLQLLLENAVKHNQVMPSRKLYITIREDGDLLVIENNIQTKKVVKESSGVGLQNIRQRYHLLTDRPMKIEDDKQTFKVSIPLLTQQSGRIMQTQESYISGKKYERARKQVEELKGFYIHFTIYLIMVPVFVYLNYISTSFPWALFPIIGWGSGVSAHAMEVFNYNPFLGKGWEDRKIKEFMDEDRF